MTVASASVSATLSSSPIQYPGRAFKIPTIDGWTVILNGSNLLDDLRKASDDELSSMEAIEDVRYPLAPGLHSN